MKMYACRRMGRGYDTASARDFARVNFLNKENTSITITKDAKTVFDAIGFNVDKNLMPGGSRWLYNQDILPVRDGIANMPDPTHKHAAIIIAITAFMSICLDRGYDVRFY